MALTAEQQRLVVEYALSIADGDPEVAARTAVELALSPNAESQVKTYAGEREAALAQQIADQDAGRARLEQEKARYAEAKK